MWELRGAAGRGLRRPRILARKPALRQPAPVARSARRVGVEQPAAWAAAEEVAKRVAEERLAGQAVEEVARRPAEEWLVAGAGESQQALQFQLPTKPDAGGALSPAARTMPRVRPGVKLRGVAAAPAGKERLPHSGQFGRCNPGNPYRPGELLARIAGKST